ncbi:hypothetical protein ACH121_32685 [Streptomyces sp. NB004]
MARRAVTMTTAAAFTATATLLLTACGGGDESSPEDIKGAGAGVLRLRRPPRAARQT